MNESPIASFLDKLREYLPDDSSLQARVLAEAEDHIRETAARLRLGGLAESEALERAIADFGEADVVAGRFIEEVPEERSWSIQLWFAKWSSVMAVLGFALMLPAVWPGGLEFALSHGRAAPFGVAAAAIALNLLAMTRIDLRWSPKRVSGSATWKWKALNSSVVALAAILLCVLSVQSWEEGPSERSRAKRKAVLSQKEFTATGVARTFDDSDIERSTATTMQAYRTDGSMALWSRTHVSLPELAPRLIELGAVVDHAVDRFATFAPDYQLISSQGIPRRPLNGYYHLMFNGRRREACSILLSALEQDPDTRRSTRLGYEVLFHDYGDMFGDNRRGAFTEAWIAPALDCYEISSLRRLGHPDPEQRRVLGRFDAVAITETEPAARAFEIPQGFEEGPPSRIRIELDKVLRPLLESNVSGASIAQADEQYRENRSDD